MSNTLKNDYLKMPKNFMTPNVLKFEQVGDKILELSTGFGISNAPIWGVSEFVKGDTRFGLESTGNGKMFENPKSAKHYYSLLKQNV